MWGDRGVNALMISIEPADLIRLHLSGVDPVEIEGDEGDRFELQEVAVFGGLIRDAKKQVLMPDPEFAGSIEAGFIGEQHTLG